MALGLGASEIEVFRNATRFLSDLECMFLIDRRETDRDRMLLLPASQLYVSQLRKRIF